MLTAMEAHTEAERVAFTKEERKRIEKYVNDAVSRGKLSCSIEVYYNTADADFIIADDLRADGYVVSFEIPSLAKGYKGKMEVSW